MNHSGGVAGAHSFSVKAKNPSVLNTSGNQTLSN